MALDDLLPTLDRPVSGESSQLWEGTILDDATSATDLVRVALPGADNEQHAQGPCPFTPHDGLLPRKGERCLVAIDDDGERWIVAFTPKAGRAPGRAVSVLDYYGSLPVTDSGALALALAASDTVYIAPHVELDDIADVVVNGKTLYGGGTIRKDPDAQQGLILDGDRPTLGWLVFDSPPDTTPADQPTDVRIAEGAIDAEIGKGTIFKSTSVYSAVQGSIDTDIGGTPYTTPVDGVTIHGARFVGTYVRPLMLSSLENITIALNTFRDCTKDAIRLRENDGFCTIDANKFINVGEPSDTVGIQTRDAIDCYWSGDKLSITNNTVRGTGFHGFDIKGSSLDNSYGTTEVVITGNKIQGARLVGIRVAGEEVTSVRPPPTWFLVGLTITDNKVTRNGYHGIEVWGCVKHAKIRDNDVMFNGGRGIYVRNFEAGYGPNKHIHIDDNDVVNNGDGASEIYGIIATGVDFLNVRRNTVSNDPDLENAGNQQIGMFIDGGTDALGFTPTAKSYRIDDNTVEGHATAQIVCRPTNAMADAIASFEHNIQSGTGAIERAGWQNERSVFHGNGPPALADGTFRRGDIIWNTLHGLGVTPGWVCTVAGAPGTWRAMAPIQNATTVNTDAAFTLTPQSSPPITFHTGTLTANRAVTLSTTGAAPGDRFRIVRTGGGAFTLDVGTGPLKSLATNTWAEFIYDATSSAWKLAAYGAL